MQEASFCTKVGAWWVTQKHPSTGCPTTNAVLSSTAPARRCFKCCGRTEVTCISGKASRRPRVSAGTGCLCPGAWVPASPLLPITGTERLPEEATPTAPVQPAGPAPGSFRPPPVSSSVSLQPQLGVHPAATWDPATDPTAVLLAGSSEDPSSVFMTLDETF